MKGGYFITCQQHGELRQFTYDTEQLPKLSLMISDDFEHTEVLHLAVHISHLLLTYKLATIEEIVGDFGLLHELAHLYESHKPYTPCAASVQSLIELADKLQSRL